METKSAKFNDKWHLTVLITIDIKNEKLSWSKELQPLETAQVLGNLKFEFSNVNTTTIL